MRSLPIWALLPPLIFAGLAALFWAGMQREDPRALESTMVGRQAPAVVDAPFAELAPFDDDALRAPGVKLVNFFASWCAPCRVEHPFLVEIAESGVPVYGVNRDRDVAKGRAFLAELGNPYAGVVHDPENRMGIDWGVYGLPETFVVDAEGKVLLRLAGAINAPLFERRIAPLLDAR